jgi:hypothetical protein
MILRTAGESVAVRLHRSSGWLIACGAIWVSGAGRRRVHMKSMGELAEPEVAGETLFPVVLTLPLEVARQPDLTSTLSGVRCRPAPSESEAGRVGPGLPRAESRPWAACPRAAAGFTPRASSLSVLLISPIPGRARHPAGDELLVAAYHRKDDGGLWTPAFALRLRFAPGGAVTVAAAELAEAPDLLARTSVARRLTAALAAEALTLPQLAAVAASEATVGRGVWRLREQDRVVLVDNAQPWRWELASR